MKALVPHSVVVGLVAVILNDASVEAQTISLGEYETVEFSPARGSVFRVPFQLTQAASVALTMLSSDGHLVTEIRSPTQLEPGAHELTWDGKDDTGVVVPDEAYVPVLAATLSDDKQVTLDPRSATGGETIDEVPVRIVNESDIEYRLPAPARVLIRIGIGGGPMLRELASWAPRVSGSNLQRWNGYDSDGIERLAGMRNLKVLVAAFKLPTHSIITSGNTAISYLEYHKSKGWEDPEIRPEDMALERGGDRISRYYFQSRAMSRQPAVELELVGGVEPTSNAPLLVRGPVTVRVNVPKVDRWLLQSSQYEIAFFVDHEFVSEEESGYVPLTWRWDPVALAPGTHVLTTNITGLAGQVGVKTVRFQIPGG